MNKQPENKQPERLPQWARDRLEEEAQMGELESSAPIGVQIVGVLYIGFIVGAFAIVCVIVYLIGKAIAG